MLVSDAVQGLGALWQETTGDPRICIAVLDGPVDLRHPCFAGARLESIETLVAPSVGDDIASRHGTHVASVLFGQHGTSVAGVAPGVRGLIVPIYAKGQAGHVLACSQLDLARAINQALTHGAHIINISGGDLSPGGEPEPMLARALEQCAEQGVLIVAAAGNDGCRCLHVPAAAPSVLAVGAMDERGLPLASSNWGDSYRSHGIVAYGRDIRGAVPGGGVEKKSGTSFATAIVSGVAGLLLSLELKLGRRPDPNAVRAIIAETVELCDTSAFADCSRSLLGRLDVGASHRRLVGLPAKVTRLRERQEKTLITNGNEENDTMEGSALGVRPSECTCGAAKAGATDAKPAPTSEEATSASKPEMAYALGQVGYDFGTEARRDSFVQQAGGNVMDARVFLEHLKAEPWAAASVAWTLNVDTTPMYAIVPVGPYAPIVYERLREFLNAQLTEGVERVSIPGTVKGSLTLMNGHKVPRLYPELRGMYSWSTSRLLDALVGAPPAGDDPALAADHASKVEGIRNFLDRIYYELRNLGATPQERAMNYAATNAFQLLHVYADAIKASLKLDSISTERSALGRPGSECWDVKLTFFHPTKRLEHARRIYRFTVDVSDLVPVSVGKVKQWDAY